MRQRQGGVCELEAKPELPSDALSQIYMRESESAFKCSIHKMALGIHHHTPVLSVNVIDSPIKRLE